MLYPGECRFVLSSDSPEKRLEYCKDYDLFGREYFYVTDDYVLPLINLFKKYYPLIYKLTDIMIRDLAGLRGTHAWKNRTIARLKKFLRILMEIGGDWGLHHVSLYTLFEEKTEDLKEIIEALETVKNEYHRVRDPVHELFYPHIRGILEDLRTIRIIYPVCREYGRKLEYEIEFDKENRHYIEVTRRLDIPGHYFSLKNVPIDEVKEVVNKRINRRERKKEDQRRRFEYWKCLMEEDMYCWDPQENILDKLTHFLKGIGHASH